MVVDLLCGITVCMCAMMMMMSRIMMVMSRILVVSIMVVYPITMVVYPIIMVMSIYMGQGQCHDCGSIMVVHHHGSVSIGALLS